MQQAKMAWNTGHLHTVLRTVREPDTSYRLLRLFDTLLSTKFFIREIGLNICRVADAEW